MQLTTIPQEDWKRTSLAQEYTGWLGNMFLQSSPNFTMPVWETCYVVLQANWANPFLAEFDSIDTGNNTINITNVTLFKGAGIANPTGITYPTNTEVLISDNFQFWSDIKDAINSKLDSNWGNTTTTWDLQVQGSAFRIRLDAWDMKFTDDNNVEISLSTIAAASWADRKVAISAADTTPGELNAKIVAWDGITSAILNPAWDEDLQLAIDLITTNGLKITTNQLDIEPATNTQVGTQRIATDAEALALTLENVSVNPKQLATSIIKSNVIDWTLLFTNTAWSEVFAHGLSVIPTKFTIFLPNRGSQEWTTTYMWVYTTDWVSTQEKWVAFATSASEPTTIWDFILKFTSQTWPTEEIFYTVWSIDGTNITLTRSITWTPTTPTWDRTFIMIVEWQ